ncbi:MAG TPA: hypothetical protein VFY93_05800 [Planctomycetota bacterium]|nr:hypothetical protein [Planctomycetota bacterium]
MSDALRRFDRAIADALTAADPVEALRAAAAGDWPPELRDALAAAAAQEDGVRLTGLLVVKLRFERLVQGSRRAGEWFDRDPKGFTDAFRRYHAAVPPTAADPRAEAALFERWCDAQDASG